MENKPKIKDPLGDIDPVMEQAFSLGDDDAYEEVETAPEEPVAETPNAAAPTVSDIQFPKLSEAEGTGTLEQDIFSNIPVNVSVELGRSNVSLKEVYELSEGSIIELERLVGEPLDLVVNGQVIAQGEVVAIDNNYGLRVTQILSSQK